MLMQKGQCESFIQAVGTDRGSPEGGALGSSNPITFRVQVSSHLHSVARLPLLYVLVHGGLQQVGILALGLPDSHHALVGGPDEHGRVGRLHVGPHLLKHGNLWPLKFQPEGEKKKQETDQAFSQFDKLTNSCISREELMNIKNQKSKLFWVCMLP